MLIQADGRIRFAPSGVFTGFLSNLIHLLHVRTVLLRSWVHCIFARPACEHVAVHGVHEPTGTQDCSAGPVTLRAHRTDVGHYFEYPLHEFALLSPAVAPGTVAAKKNTARPPEFPRAMVAS
jgi:hypothetical protein